MTELKVNLVNIFDDAYNNAVATARTCYSSKGIVTPEQTAEKPELRDMIASSTFQAGHHTVLQHTHVQFAIDGISRYLTWALLHNHQLYNSEVLSQRYCKISVDNFVYPTNLSADKKDKFTAIHSFLAQAYVDFSKELKPLVDGEYYKRFPGRAKKKDKYKGQITKKAQEVGRYFLPLGVGTSMYHTVSLLTLIRYHNLVQRPHLPEEARLLVSEMVRLVLEREPGLSQYFETQIPAEHFSESEFQYDPSKLELTNHTADQLLAVVDSDTRLLNFTGFNSLNVALATSSGDTAAPMSLLEPSRNALLGSTINLTMHDPLLRTLELENAVFLKRLSHAADCQEQRHRTSVGARPLFLSIHQPDYMVPTLVKGTVLEGRYHAIMREAWSMISELISEYPDHTSAHRDLVYLLPNAVNVRYVSNSTLGGLVHKYRMRLCYNAQEEIWLSTKSEVSQLAQADISTSKLFMPPCTARKAAGIKPFCPEGDKYCGVPVWNLKLEEYERVI